MFDGHGFFGGFMWIFWILIIAAVIWFIAVATRRDSGSPGRDKSAREILEERYARGEIDRDEYQQKKRDLES